MNLTQSLDNTVPGHLTFRVPVAKVINIFMN